MSKTISLKGFTVTKQWLLDNVEHRARLRHKRMVILLHIPGKQLQILNHFPKDKCPPKGWIDNLETLNIRLSKQQKQSFEDFITPAIREHNAHLRSIATARVVEQGSHKGLIEFVLPELSSYLVDAGPVAVANSTTAQPERVDIQPAANH